MTSVPRKFQTWTVKAAVGSLRGPGRRRFLVADEVGLGKTTVAREVVRELSKGGSKPLVVYYITNNTRVSDQNASRLVDFLESDKDRMAALSTVDRLSMIPLDKPSSSPLRLYSLGPQTSFPPATSRPNPGQARERAFLDNLLERAVPGLREALPEGFMRQRAYKQWPKVSFAAETFVAGIGWPLVNAYRTILSERYGRGLKRKIADAAASDSPSRTLTELRRMLAEACLRANPPDLIIFDEFQRFRELLSPKQDDHLGRALLAGGRRKPAMLLLSATPYRLYAEGWEAKDGHRPHEELFEVIGFLAGEEVKEESEELFARFGEVLRAIGEADGDLIDVALRKRADGLRSRMQDLLRPHVARTERPALPPSQAANEANRTKREPLPVEIADLRVFKHFAEKVTNRNRSAATAYWLSVPLPAQALGASYKITKDLHYDRVAGVPVLGPKQKANRVSSWGSPKLRELLAISPAKELALPWVAPSIEWWPLSGPWTGGPSPKTLLFSRFRATPQSVASLTSLEVERTYLAADRGSKWDGQRLQAKSGLPVLALFHPSPFLIRATDPLDGRHATEAQALQTVTRQLRAALRMLDINVRSNPVRDARRSRALWVVLAGIERKSGDFDLTQAAWTAAAGYEAALGRIVNDRLESHPIDWISIAEFKALAKMALSGPAVVVGRAWLRHFDAALEEPNFEGIVGFCWHRLRRYLDNKVFWGLLGPGRITDVLQTAIMRGGLESVLDEHFWLAQGQTAPNKLLQELGSALRASLGSFTFKGLRPTSDPIRLRCHAAVPFSGSEKATQGKSDSLQTDSDEEPPRSEELRRAFNSPFWPHLLATTSVGQEGLDFHSWCHRIVHWDLPSNPVDLEQREGRIARYAGLLVRRPMALDLKTQALAEVSIGYSPWKNVAALAEKGNQEGDGLAPWWIYDNATLSRHVLTLTKSREHMRFDHLQRQRLLYRLALGQPNQEDLVNHLAQGSDAKISALSELALDLSPSE